MDLRNGAWGFLHRAQKLRAQPTVYSQSGDLLGGSQQKGDFPKGGSGLKASATGNRQMRRSAREKEITGDWVSGI
jgi:hypothetical protein